ncbi:MULTISPECIES: potassium channel family protein [Cupriavidus]|uniref:Potassium channel domain-containing protein n=1 Tax=Cupriavidus pinatubonensis (strain JMP 134 / LMG 1197) TaxID=264198 RepID=Q470T1_CUPPJ|nr:MULTISPECIES: potassium channel family protein [Cupriavidus]QYY33268.1 potassium channel family protein [Cupriavidus pinatubonensis]TPQ36885.1 two pore domain potassium channel family protein [Cupriavidus pinatubonensis]
MRIHLLVAIPVMLTCLLLQSLVVALCLRRYARFRNDWHGGEPLWVDVAMLSAVMLTTLCGNFAQMAIWAGLFLLLGEFTSFGVALYHSAVNFSTLGYGDIVMSENWRMLGPIEAAHGILMFGVSTAVMTAAVLDVVKISAAKLSRDAKDETTAADNH